MVLSLLLLCILTAGLPLLSSYSREDTIRLSAGVYSSSRPEFSKTILSTLYDSSLSSRKHIQSLVCQLTKLDLKLLIYVLNKDPLLIQNSTARSISYPVDSLAKYVSKYRRGRTKWSAREDLWHVDFNAKPHEPSTKDFGACLKYISILELVEF